MGNTKSLQQHWENIYLKNEFYKLSWYQQTPMDSIEMISKTGLTQTAKIIDIGGGNSSMPGSLIDLVCMDITVLDISETALEQAQQLLGEKSQFVKWINENVLDYSFPEKFDLWHDRACFHFLMEPADQNKYLESLLKNLRKNGFLILSTFSLKGPDKCSGLPVQKYSAESLSGFLGRGFELLDSFERNHITPRNSLQNYLTTLFIRK